MIKISFACRELSLSSRKYGCVLILLKEKSPSNGF